MLGILVANDQLVRYTANPPAHLTGIEAVRAFYAIPLGEILMFCALTFLGFRNRFRPARHKRLMLIATLAILETAVVRWPIFESFAEPVIDGLYVVTILLLLIAYDWLSTGQVQSVTLWAGAFVVVAQQARYLIGHTALWQAFAAWVQTWALAFH